MQNHAFFIALAYGVGALVLVAEMVFLWRRSQSACSAHQEAQARP